MVIEPVLAQAVEEQVPLDAAPLGLGYVERKKQAYCIVDATASQRRDIQHECLPFAHGGASAPTIA